MKIAISTSVIQRGRTGIAQYTRSLLKALLPYADRHEFHLLVLREDLPLFEFVQPRLKLVPIEERWRPALRNIVWHQIALPRLARGRGWDLLHVPSYRRLVWARTCRLTATLHDLAPFRLPGKYDPARMLYGRVVAKALAHRQDAIIAVSRHTAQDIEHFFGITPPRLHVIHNGIDHDRFHPGDRTAALRTARERHGLDRPFFLYLSRLEHPAKNHVRLIQAYEQFRREHHTPWLLAFAGADWHGAEHIHRAAAQSPFAADIRRLGFVAEQDVPDLYRAAATTVFPSLHEGFGFPPLEAMACACPVISSNRGALQELVTGAAEIIDPESVESLAEALRKLSTDDAHRTSLVESGLAQARRFDWSRCARETVAVWENARPGPPRVDP